MFNYNKYEKEYNKVYKEEHRKYDWEKMNKTEKHIANMIINDEMHKLNNNYSIIFAHTLSNAWFNRMRTIFILDTEKDNIFTFDFIKNIRKSYTISDEYINLIKDAITKSSDIIFKDIAIPDPPLFDGFFDDFYISNFKEYRFVDGVHCHNLSYFREDINKMYFPEKKIEEQKIYAIKLVKVIDIMQDVLNKNNIDFKILDY